MGIKKYFVDNAAYGTDALNKIVGALRTTGVYGEIIDCLKVTAGSGTTVNIADGVGWVDGCQIEVDGGASLVLPSANGTYSVVMALDKDGDTVNDIALAYESGEVTGAHVLAWAAVSGGSVTAVTDKRVNSTFAGATQYSPVYYTGHVDLTGFTAGTGIVKTFSVPLGCQRVRFRAACGTGATTGCIVEIGAGLNMIYGSQSRTDYVCVLGLSSLDFGDGSGYAGPFGPYNKLKSVAFSGGTVSMTFNISSAASANDIKIDWEAW